MKILSFGICVFAVGALAAAVGDYTRTVVSSRLNGWDGVEFIKWEKGSDATAGRAWAVKFDLSRGYRLRTQFGNAQLERARVGEMAETIAAQEGCVPIMGMNADYFDVNVSYARCTGLVITDDALVTRGFTNAAAAAMCYMMQTADGNLVHSAMTRDPAAPSGCPTAAWQLTANGRKIRQAIRTNYCNYPVKAGQMNPVANPVSPGGATFPTTIGNMQSRTTYPRPLIGIGTNAVGVATNLVLFLNDGRQSGWSYHFPDTDSAEIMIAEGCSEVGEFDGGGSAAMWMAYGPDSEYNITSDSYRTAHGDYVNRPSDGAPRTDACGIFVLPPTNTVYTVEVNDGNLYPDLDAALAVVAPGDVVKVKAPTTLTTRSFPRSCTILCADPASAPIACAAGALSVPAGVRVCFSNLAFTAAQTVTVAAGGTAALAGAVDIGSVDVTAGGVLELAGPITRDVTLVQADGSAGSVACQASVPLAELGDSLSHVRNASDQTLALQATGAADGVLLRWARAADLDGGLSAANYVQDGLVAQFDGIENAGVGVHSAQAAKWVDLKGSASLTPSGTAWRWGPNYFDSSKTNQTFGGMPGNLRNHSITVETAVYLVTNGVTAETTSTATMWPYLWRFDRCSMHSTGVTKYNGRARDFRFFLNGMDPRPYVFGVYTNTLSCVSDLSSFRIYKDAAFSQSCPAVPTNGAALSTWCCLNSGGDGSFLQARYYGFRVYNRGLTVPEMRWNTMIDRIRFWSPRHAGAGGTADWDTLAWTNAEGESVPAPESATNSACAMVSHATVRVAAADAVGLLALSLEDNAKLDVAADAAVSVRVLFVGGVAVPRGVYTGTGALGTQTGWLLGAGVVRVGGGLDDPIPSDVLLPGADGWHTFGKTSAQGGGWGWGAGYQGGTTKYHWIAGDWPDWSTYAFPEGAKLRLRGHLILDTVPVHWFSAIDASDIEYAVLHQAQTFSDGRALVIPPGRSARFQACTWRADSGKWWLVSTSGAGAQHDGPIEVNGCLRIYGDGAHIAKQTYTGRISGSGTIYLTSYSNQGRFRGPWDFSGTLECSQNACGVWIDTVDVSSALNSALFGSCAGPYATNAWYCSSGILFGINGSDTRAKNELYIKTLTGNALSLSDPKGRRFRVGGGIVVWGSNTVHVGELKEGVHVVARRQDQDCVNNFWGEASAKGIGFLVVDRLTNGTIYGSTNVALTIGQIVSGSTFDYTYQKDGVNRLTLDITNGCPAGASVKATDLAMLPARVSGFAGNVTLTETAAKAYTLPLDFSAGTDTLYNTVGCIGSGTLAAAPAESSVDVTFPTSVRPQVGDYALARFTSGGDRLAGWTVTLNGAAVQSVGLSGGFVATVRRDATGLWIAVRRSGFMSVIR